MIADTIIDAQRAELKKAHNARFVINNHEYRIKYEVGIADSFAVYGRPVGTRYYQYIVGFSGFKLYSKEQVISMAKELARKDANSNGRT